MSPAAGPFMIAAVLLLLGGSAKAIHPDDTARALGGIGVPARPIAVRIGGAIEAAVAVAAILLGDRATAVLVALSYAGFAVFVAVALARRVPLATCGCFGREDTPPSALHLCINLAAVVSALAVVADPGVGMGDVLADQPLGGFPFLLLVLTGTTLAYLALTSLPRTLALVRETPRA